MAGKLFLTALLIFLISIISGVTSAESNNKRLERFANFLFFVAIALGFSAALVRIWL
jgi:ABC-type dipeptide/oligopeptide/nickel transport system permease component